MIGADLINKMLENGKYVTPKNTTDIWKTIIENGQYTASPQDITTQSTWLGQVLLGGIQFVIKGIWLEAFPFIKLVCTLILMGSVLAKVLGYKDSSKYATGSFLIFLGSKFLDILIRG